MAYSAVPTVATGDLWTSANHNTYIRDNFAAGVPDLFTAKGDVAVGSGADAAGRLPMGSDGQVIVADSTQTLGMKYAWAGIPVGGILIWSGSVGTIPTGFQLCNGTNGTPDLRNNFVPGAGSTYNPGDTGGATTHTHTQSATGAEAAHTHTQGNTGNEAAHTHSISGTTGGGSGEFGASGPDVQHVSISTHTHNFTATSGAGASHAHSNPTTAVGSSHTHANPTTAAGSSLPPYYALAYIMRMS